MPSLRLVAVMTIAATAAGQSFEAAMLRLEDPNSKVDYNRPDAPNQTRVFPTNLLLMYHTYLKSLIAIAYGVKYQNILNGPGWIDSQHYDLSAKVPGDARLTREQMAPMLRNLLVSRFHLAIHTEQQSRLARELTILLSPQPPTALITAAHRRAQHYINAPLMPVPTSSPLSGSNSTSSCKKSKMSQWMSSSSVGEFLTLALYLP